MAPDVISGGRGVSKSLQEQLLKAGLIKQKQLQKSQSEQRKQTRVQQHSKAGVVDEAKEAAKLALAQKAERDRQLAKAQNEAAETRAFAAQIRQIITMNRLPRNLGDTAYNFVDQQKVKTLYVDLPTLNHLSAGRLAIVKLDDKYEIVPQSAAVKISARDASVVIVCNEKTVTHDTAAEDDPYAAFQVPDDLMW